MSAIRSGKKRSLKKSLNKSLEAAGKFLGKRNPGTLLALSGAVAGVVSLLQASSAKAATYNWAGGTSADMNTASNWGGTLPGTLDVARWNAPSYTNAPNMATANMTIGEMLFDTANTSALTFGAGTYTLTLSGVSNGTSTIGIQVNSGSGVVNTGSAAIVLGSSQTWLNNSGSTLTVGGTVKNNSGTANRVLTIDGSGNISLAGIISNSTSTATTGIVKQGAGTLSLGAGANTFTGGLVIKQGTVNSGNHNNSLGASTNVVTIGDATLGQNATLNIANGARSYANPITIASGAGTRTISSSFTTGATSMTGVVTLNGNLTLTSGTANQGAFSFTGGFVGSGNLTLNSNSTNAAALTLSTGAVNMSGTITNTGTGAVGAVISTAIGSNVTGVTQNSANSPLYLSGVNSNYTNGITITTGGLIFVTTSAKPTSGTTTVANGASLGLNLAGASPFTTTDLANLFANTMTNVSMGATANAGIDTTNGNYTLTNTIASSTRGLAKFGANTLILTSTANAYTGATVIYSGTLQLGDGTSGNDGSISGTSGVTNNGALVFNHASNQTATYSISGTGSVSKLGTYTLTLSGSNSYTGATTVSGGTLKAESSTALGSGALTVTSPGVLDLGGNSFTVASLAAGTGTITDSSPAGSGGKLTVNASLASNAGLFTGSLALGLWNGNGSTFLTNSNNTYSGGTTLGIGSTNSARWAPATGTTVGNGTPGALTSGIFGTGPIIIGATATDKAQIYFNAANVTINNAIIYNSTAGTDKTASTRIDTAGHVLAGVQTANLSDVSLRNDGGTGGITVTGQITGSKGLSVAANSALTVTLSNTSLANPNNYNGDTFIYDSKSTLILGAADQIPNGAGKGNLNTNTTGIFNMGGFSETINGLSGGGTVDGVSGTVTLTLGDGDATASFSGVIKDTAGTLSLTKIGTGVQTLSNSNSTYAGKTTISAGTVSISSIGNVGAASSALGAPTTVANGTIDLAGTLTYTGAATSTDRVINLTGTSTVNNSGSGQLTLTGGVTGSGGLSFRGAGNIQESGVIGSGISTVTHTDPGTLYLTNAGNAFTGDLFVSTGVINVTSISDGGVNSAIGAGSQIGLGQNLSAGTGIGTLQFAMASGGSTNRSILIRNGATGGAGILDSTVSGQTVTLSGDVTAVSNSSSSALTLQGVGNGVLSGSIAGSPNMSLTKTGTGMWTLSGSNNTYTGATTVSGGTLWITDDNALGSSAGGTVQSGTSELRISGGITVNDALQINGGGISNAGALRNYLNDNTWSGMITLAAQSRINSDSGTLTLNAPTVATGAFTLVVGGAGNILVSGALSNGTGGLSKDGSGTLTLSSASTYTGATTVSAGTVNITGKLGNTAVSVSGGTLSLQSAGAVSQNTLTVSGTGQLTETVTNAMNGTAGLTVSAGTAILPYANNFSGTTTVTGTLQLGNAGSIASSPLTLNAGATLQLRAGSSTTFTAASITPSNGAITINVANNGSGTDNKLTLGNAMTWASNATPTINVTGANGYDLALGALSAPSGSGGPYVFTVNPTTADVTIASFTAGSYGSTLTFTSANTATATLNSFIMGSNGSNGITVNGANVVLAGANGLTNGRTSGNLAITLTSGTLNVNNAGAFTNAGSASTSTFTINGGTLDNTSAGAITMTANATQSWNGNFTFGGTKALNLGTGAVAMNASRQVTVNGTGALTVGGIISGNTFGLTKAGAGTLNLTGANTFNGALVIKEGTLQANNAAAITASASLTLGDSTGVSTNPATLDVTSTTGGYTYTKAINVVGTNQVNTIRDGNFTQSYSGAITLSNADLTLNQGTTAAMTVTGGITGTGDLIISNTGSGGSMTLSGGGVNMAGLITNNGGGASPTVISSVIGSNVTGVVQNSSASTLTISAANTALAGGVTLTAGTLYINNAAALGNGTFAINGGTVDNSSAAAITNSQNNAISIGGNFAFTGTKNLDLGNGNVTLNGVAGSRTITANAGILTLGGVIADGSATGLTKAGTGTLTLEGASTYSGGTTLSAGQLNINNGGSGGTSSAVGTGRLTLSGGTIDNTSGGTVSLSTNNVQTWTDGASVVFTGTNALDFGTGAVTLGTATTGTFTLTNNSALSGTSLTVGGTITGGTGGSVGGKTLAIAGNGNTDLDGVISKGGAAGFYISKSGSGTLTLGATSTINQITLNAGTVTIAAGQTLSLSNGGNPGITGTGGTINGPGTLALASGTSGNYLDFNGTTTINAKITGAYGIDFYNNGTITLTNTTSDFSGQVSMYGTKVSTPMVGNSGSTSPLGTYGTINFGNSTNGGGYLIYTGSGETTNKVINLGKTTADTTPTIDIQGTGNLKFTSNLTAAAATHTLNLTGSSDGTGEIAGLIPDNSLANKTSVTKSGSGQWTLSGLSASTASNYSGTTTIGQGTLAITTTNPSLAGGLTFGVSTGSTYTGMLDLSGVNATFGGALVVQTNSATANTINIDSGKTLQLNGSVTVGYNSAATSITKLTASGLGTLSIGSSGTPTNANVQIGNGATASISNGATVDLSGLSTFYANLGTGFLKIGSPTNSGGAATVGSTMILAPDSTINASSLLLESPDGSVIEALKLGSIATVLNVNTLTVGGGINNGRSSGTLDFNGVTGTLKVRSNADSVNGRATLNVANVSYSTGYPQTGVFDTTGHSADLMFGTMTIGSRTSNNGVTGGTFSFDMGTLDANDLIAGNRSTGATGSSTTSGTVNLGGGTVTFNSTSGPIQLGVNASTAAGSTASGILNISGGSVTVAANGGNSIRLGDASVAGGTASGAVNITGGTLTVAGDIVRGAAVGTSNATLTLDGGTLDMGGKNIGASGADVSFTAESGTLKNLNELNGGGTLTKTTAGTLTLMGTNSYTGATVISGGTLSVNGSLGNTAVAVNTGGTLGGTGTIAGSVTVNSGGHLAPGNSPGALIINNTLTLTSGSVSDFEIASASSYDQVTGLTGLSYGGTLNVTGTIASTPHAYTLFSTTSHSGTFDTVNLASAPTGYRWHDYDALTAGIQGFDYTTGQIQLEAANSAAVKLGLVASALSSSLRSDTTDTNDENGMNAVGTIHVTGSNGGFVSEIDGLTNEAGVHDFAEGYVQVDNDLSPAPTLVMLWLKDTNTGDGIAKSDVINSLAANAGGAYTVLTSSDAAWQKLAGAYSGFDTIIDFGSVMGTGDAFSWKFEGDYATITVDKVAVVPEPGSLGLLGLGALGLMGSRRRKSKKVAGESALSRFYGRRQTA